MSGSHLPSLIQKQPKKETTTTTKKEESQINPKVQLQKQVRDLSSIRLSDENKIDQLNDRLISNEKLIEELKNEREKLHDELHELQNIETDAFELSPAGISKKLHQDLRQFKSELNEIQQSISQLEKENNTFQIEILKFQEEIQNQNIHDPKK